MSKLSIACVILLIMVLMLTNISFAAESTIDFNSLLNTEEIEEESDSTGDSTTGDDNTSGDNATGDSASGDNGTESDSTGDTSADKTNNSSQSDNKPTTVNTVTDDSKLPQTGEKENIALIASAAVFVILAVVAYKNIKKYNVK